jgi:transposase
LPAQRFVFQQDNARPHSARFTTQFLTANNILTLSWPSLSPDMNPIEHLWDQLQRRVCRRNVYPANRRELWQALQEEWAAIPQAHIRHLITSMPRRCQSLIDARGGHTPY